MATLAEIRAKLQQQDNKRTDFVSDGGIYAHWNIPENTSARIRFLPDADTNNPYFWIERAMIKLPFAGIKGQSDSKPTIVSVPCMEMWNETCPILAEVRPWFKDKSLEEMGRKYWKKRSFLFQGFVRESPIKDDATPENPIRRFIINAQIMNLIKAALMDPEMEELPTDYLRGLDFVVSKTSKGAGTNSYADYTTSKWSRKESALTEDEQGAIEKFGLFDLSTFLPNKPDAAALEIMKEMFEASVDGQPYDEAKWGAFFRPAGMAFKGDDKDAASTPAAKAAPKAAPAPAAKEDWKEDAKAAAESLDDDDDSDAGTTSVSAPVEAGAGSKRAEDILAMIRNRQK